MNCKKCGFYISDKNQKSCGNCGEIIQDASISTKTTDENIEKQSQIFLIIGIVLAFCCSLPFGVAIILINEYKYKKELIEGNMVESSKTKKLMIILSCIGFVFGILFTGLSFFFNLLAAFE